MATQSGLGFLAGLVTLCLTAGACSGPADKAGDGIKTQISAGPQKVGQLTQLDGVYRMTLPEKDVPPREAVENWGDFIYVLARGRFATTQQNARACTWAYGTYQVNGNQLIMDNIAGGGIAPTGATIKGGERFVLSWSRYRDTVKLIPIDPPNIGLKPWHLISRRPSAAYFPRRCPPPAGALTG